MYAVWQKRTVGGWLSLPANGEANDLPNNELGCEATAALNPCHQDAASRFLPPH